MQNFPHFAQGIAGVDDIFDNQHIFAADIFIQILQNLHVAGRIHAAAVTGGGHKIHLVGKINGAAQIGHKHKGAAQQSHQHHIVAAVAVMLADLASEFGHPRLDLPFGDHNVHRMFHHTDNSQKKGIQYRPLGPYSDADTQPGCAAIHHGAQYNRKPGFTHPIAERA
ncbi:hypothetical protein Dda3937_04071 [Dickeya dadantii 3937]|uniref:Uncharacterized protein n=1 Tax=Dickeya dadantii (strain 3937) TaxID=198628 RepID=E0SBM2_DICD3|nr:hypothetical protein Dda3937_04071 [Dickeya dadantii 3937]